MDIDAVPPAWTSGSWLSAKRRVVVVIGAALLCFVGSSIAMLARVDVSNGGVGATRTCGSPFDIVVDRSGWELWWARDLDEADSAVRAALVRTQLCPDAINVRLAVAVGLAVVSSAMLLTALWSQRDRRDAVVGSSLATVGRRVTLLGRATAWTGAALAVSGILAIVVLVGDADSDSMTATGTCVPSESGCR